MLKLIGGTGFIVNEHGDIVTNAHVIHNCQAITVATERGEQPAQLIVADKLQDLAIIRIPTSGVPAVAPLRFDISALRVGDPVTVIGYPGQDGIERRSHFKKTTITSLKGPAGEAKWLQLVNVAEKGNSGGPVLDEAGNVIAVIAGMVLQYRKTDVGKPDAQPIAQASVAITLPILENFLHANAIMFQKSPNELMAYRNNAQSEVAPPFIVPVRCILGRVTQ